MAPNARRPDDDVAILEPSPQKTPTPKRARAAAGHAASDDAGGSSQPQAKKPRAKKQPAGATVDELGWTVVPPSFLFR